jgi:hypothetical protein
MKYGKHQCVGCSNWSIQEKLLHRYEFIPPKVHEDTFEYVFHNNGHLPTGTASICILTVNLRIALPNCCAWFLIYFPNSFDDSTSDYTHIIDGRICVGKVQRRPCPTEMLIYIPVEGEYNGLKALVVLCNAHNHPMHPQTKPTTEDRAKLGAAVEAVGLTGLIFQKLLNGQYFTAHIPSSLIKLVYSSCHLNSLQWAAGCREQSSLCVMIWAQTALSFHSPQHNITIEGYTRIIP